MRFRTSRGSRGAGLAFERCSSRPRWIRSPGGTSARTPDASALCRPRFDRVRLFFFGARSALENALTRPAEEREATSAAQNHGTDGAGIGRRCESRRAGKSLGRSKARGKRPVLPNRIGSRTTRSAKHESKQSRRSGSRDLSRAPGRRRRERSKARERPPSTHGSANPTRGSRR